MKFGVGDIESKLYLEKLFFPSAHQELWETMCPPCQPVDGRRAWHWDVYKAKSEAKFESRIHIKISKFSKVYHVS